MDCPECKIPMEKGHITANSKEKISYVTNWYCKKCGNREYSQYDVKF